MSRDRQPRRIGDNLDPKVQALKAAFRQMDRLDEAARQVNRERANLILELWRGHDIDPKAVRDLRRWLRDPEAHEEQLRQSGLLRPELAEERDEAIRKGEMERKAKEAARAAKAAAADAQKARADNGQAGAGTLPATRGKKIGAAA